MINHFKKYELLSENISDIVVKFNKILDNIFKEIEIDIAFLEYILTSPDLKFERESYKNESVVCGRLSFEEMVLNYSSEHNSLAALKLIFTHPHVDRKFVDRSLDYAFYLAASKGSLEAVEYLSTSFDLERLANINQIRSPLITACENGYLNVVKFLLESPNLKTKASIKEIEDYYIFSHLCKIFESNKSSNSHSISKAEDDKQKFIEKRLIVMKYLILEQKLQKNEAIDKYLNKSENQTIKLLFDVQELNSELNANPKSRSDMRKPKL